jgi:hypothetical protein
LDRRLESPEPLKPSLRTTAVTPVRETARTARNACFDFKAGTPNLVGNPYDDSPPVGRTVRDGGKQASSSEMDDETRRSEGDGDACDVKQDEADHGLVEPELFAPMMLLDPVDVFASPVRMSDGCPVCIGEVMPRMMPSFGHVVQTYVGDEKVK